MAGKTKKQVVKKATAPPKRSKASPAAKRKSSAKVVPAKGRRQAEGVFTVEQKDPFTWCCMELLNDGTRIEHVCFDSERAADFHLRNFHPAAIATASKNAKHTAKKKTPRTLDVRPDALDFRDKMYQSTLFEVPVAIDLEEYKKVKVPILDQGKEGACTGYGLATVANYLLRCRKRYPDERAVSPKMLYQLAKRYDEWRGENYSGSSARGAMKGWHKHGVCAEDTWPARSRKSALTEDRIKDAIFRPLGAYYRVNHKDLIAMHSAMAEVGVLYATAVTHAGWDEVGEDGIIPFREEVSGGHAFAIVAYNSKGFWIQNSWGASWGKEGFALISYDDWLKNATDVWVARLGAPISLARDESIAITHSSAAKKSNAYSFSQLRPHIVSIGNNGLLNAGGEYGTSAEEVRSLFEEDFPAITKSWKKKRLLLYAHGGLVSESNAVQRLADYRVNLLEAEVYPVSFIWHTDAWTTITNILRDAIQRRKPEGFLDAAKDFMLDRLDDALEPLARALTGKLQWDEMKENARLATEAAKGGVRLALDHVIKLAKKYKDNFEIHLIGHSAGSILLAHLVQYLTGTKKASGGLGGSVASCTLWAPACTIELFNETYLPGINNKKIDRFAVFNLTDEAERDDNCARIYNKSLLYLVSNAFEKKERIPVFRDGIPLLGMDKFIKGDKELDALFKSGKADLILAPNSAKEGSPDHSTCTTHGEFDDDQATVNAALSRILDTGSAHSSFDFNRSASSLKDRRDFLNTTGTIKV
ncbi:MAG: C1 family peptidase [Chitinophagaceae bacterium]|nr:C1 family peptidase [Chitinophagaceae bacterium]